MFKIDKKTNKIFLTKGDNAELTIDVIDSDGNARGIYDDDVVVMTVRKHVNSDVAITKTAIKNTISFIPDDTKSLEAGQYRYDIQLTTFGGNIYTIIPDACFEIGVEVTK